MWNEYDHMTLDQLTRAIRDIERMPRGERTPAMMYRLRALQAAQRLARGFR